MNYFLAGSKLSEAIVKGNDAINKLITAGEIEELRDVAINLPEETEIEEDYLQDEGEIDYTKVPNVDLPPPLPSSKFAQNPELLKALNYGGKRKFDQLIAWTEANPTERGNKMHQPVFGVGGMSDDSLSNNDSDLRQITGMKNPQDINYFANQDEDLRRINSVDNRGGMGRDEDMRMNVASASGPGRPPGMMINEFEMRNSFDMRNSYGDRDFRHLGPPPIIGGFKKSSMDGNDNFGSGDMDRDGRQRSWDDDKGMNSNDSGRSNFDKRDMSSNMQNNSMQMSMGNMSSGNMGSNHHNMQNISPNMPPSMMSMMPPHHQQHHQMNHLSNIQNKNNSSMMGGNDNSGPMPPHMMHMSNFGPNGPPPPMPPNFGPNFRPPNGNYGPNPPYRPNPMAPFAPSQNMPFNNNFPPPNFRGPNPGNNQMSNFDRPPGFGPNFRMSGGNQSGHGSGGGNFNSGYGKNYNNSGGGGGNMGSSGSGNNSGGNKNGPNRGQRYRKNVPN